jgi:hypothetical protein
VSRGPSTCRKEDEEKGGEEEEEDIDMEETDEEEEDEEEEEEANRRSSARDRGLRLAGSDAVSVFKGESWSSESWDLKPSSVDMMAQLN